MPNDMLSALFARFFRALQGFVSMIEHGRREIGGGMLLKISGAFGKSIDWLLIVCRAIRRPVSVPQGWLWTSFLELQRIRRANRSWHAWTFNITGCAEKPGDADKA